MIAKKVIRIFLRIDRFCECSVLVVVLDEAYKHPTYLSSAIVEYYTHKSPIYRRLNLAGKDFNSNNYEAVYSEARESMDSTMAKIITKNYYYSDYGGRGGYTSEITDAGCRAFANFITTF